MTTPSTRGRLAAAVGGLALLLAACTGDGGAESAAAPTPTTATATATPAATTAADVAATPSPAPSPAPNSGAPAAATFERPDVDLALQHVRVLAGEIGSRVSTTDEERRAAEYIAAQLEAAGYEASIEPFDATRTADESTVTLPGGTTLESTHALLNSPNVAASGRLVPAGLGRAVDLLDVDAEGAILLLDRGVIEFRTKALNAQNAGAVGVIVVNNVPGPLINGTLGDTTVSIPIVAVDQPDGAALALLVDDGEAVDIVADLQSITAPSWNVAGRPTEPCDAYVGAHYDSVSTGPGANDNASGTAAMLELARTHHADGLCFLAFGSEEIGLVGSRAFVDGLDTDGVRFMLNLDMMGKLSRPVFLASGDAGSRQLADRAAAVAADAGYDVPRGSFPANASSDHASFAAAGVPAITVTSGDDQFIHQPQDLVANVARDDLATMLEVAALVLQDLLLR